MRSIVMGRDGTWFATGSHEGTILRWRRAADEPTEIFRKDEDRFPGRGNGGEVTDLVGAPDGSWLAGAHDEGEIRIWDPASRRQTAAMTGAGEFWAKFLGVSPDGGLLATASEEAPAQLWDTRSGVLVATLAEGPPGTIHAAWITAGTTRLATAGAHGTLRVWDPATGAAVAGIRVDDILSECGWAPGGAVTATGDRGFYLFDLLEVP